MLKGLEHKNVPVQGTIMKTAIYARVSTADQSNLIQLHELEEYVERRGWELAGVYQDQMSGAKASRPGLDQLIADARRRKPGTHLRNR